MTTETTANQEIDKAKVMGGVIPYLSLAQDAGEAMTFYEKAFGAIPADDPARDENGRILNATLVINGGAFMLMDHPEWAKGTPAKGGQGVLLQLVVADGDLWWSRAIEAGCDTLDPFEKKFWGDRFGVLRDPFRQDWAILEPSPEQHGLSAGERAERGRAN